MRGMITLNGYMGSVSFDGQMVTVEKNLRGRVQFPASAVSSVMIVPAGMGMRGIKFTLSGGTDARRQMPMGSHKDVASDPYGLTFRKKHEAKFAALAYDIQRAAWA
jgi:hypothetical protein